MPISDIQSVDPKSAFCFMDDLNCHHSEWLGSLVTNAHGVTDFDFAPLTDCSQLVRGPTHQSGGILDLVLTDVPTFVRLVLVRQWPISMNWRGVRDALSSISWGPIFKSLSMIEDLDNQLSEVLLRLVQKVTVKRRSGDSPWFDDECRIAFDRKRCAYRRWCGSQSNIDWDRFVRARSEAEACYASANFIILSNVLGDLKLPCPLVTGGGPWRVLCLGLLPAFCLLWRLEGD